jgi:simple sugar transport system substrate-binding protein
MEGPRKRNWSRGGVLLAAGLLATAVALPVAAQDGVTKLGYVSPEAAEDYGWNEQGAIAAQAVAEAIGAEYIQQDGVGYSPEEVTPILNQFAEEGVDFVVAQASGYNAVAPTFAVENDIPVLIYDNFEALTEGLVSGAGAVGGEGGYLAGVLAGHMTQTGTLGIVLSASGDVNWLKQAGGFVQGARSVNPDIQFQKADIAEFGYADLEGGNRVTQQVIAAGADIVFGMGDGSSFGMLAAAAENAPPGAEKAWFIDVIGDKTGIENSEALLSSVLWDFEPIISQAVADVAAGTYGTQNYFLDIANGGLSLLDTPNMSDDARAAGAAAAAGIVDGTITVEETATAEAVDALIAG